MAMSASGRSIAIGAVAGLCGGGLTLGLALGLGTWPAALLGLVPPCLAGALAALVAGRAAVDQAAAALAGVAADPPGSALIPFDQGLAHLREGLEKARRVEKDFARAERVTRT